METLIHRFLPKSRKYARSLACISKDLNISIPLLQAALPYESFNFNIQPSISSLAYPLEHRLLLVPEQVLSTLAASTDVNNLDTKIECYATLYAHWANGHLNLRDFTHYFELPKEWSAMFKHDSEKTTYIKLQTANDIQIDSDTVLNTLAIFTNRPAGRKLIENYMKLLISLGIKSSAMGYTVQLLHSIPNDHAALVSIQSTLNLLKLLSYTDVENQDFIKSILTVTQLPHCQSTRNWPRTIRKPITLFEPFLTTHIKSLAIVLQETPKHITPSFLLKHSEALKQCWGEQSPYKDFDLDNWCITFKISIHEALPLFEAFSFTSCNIVKHH